MATLTDGYKRVRFDPDGQGLDFTDMHTLQAVALKAQLEQFLLSGVTDVIENPANPHSADAPDFETGGGFSDGAWSAADMLWCPFPSAGFIGPGAGARQLVCKVSGPIVQLADGADAFGADLDQLLVFRLPSGMAALTTAIGDAANPRIDLVEVRLSLVDGVEMEMRDFEDATTRVPTTQNTDVAHKVQCEIQIKQGTPGASPTYPTPTAGFVPMAAVWVPALHNAVHSVDNIRDLRWPIGGFRTYDVNANAFYTPGATQWTINETGQYVEAPVAGTDPMYAICPVSMKNARLLGVGVMGAAAANPTCDLVKIAHSAAGAPTISRLAAIDAGDIFDTAAFLKVGAVFLMDVLGDALGAAKGARVANRRVGSAMWCNGHPAGPAKAETLSTATATQIGIKLVSEVGGIVSLVRFYVAHGM